MGFTGIYSVFFNLGKVKVRLVLATGIDRVLWFDWALTDRKDVSVAMKSATHPLQPPCDFGSIRAA